MSKKLAISLVLATVTLQLSGLSNLALNTEAAVVNKLKQQTPVTNSSTNYDSDWINLVTDSRVSGGNTETMGPEQGGGYEGDLVRYASQNTSSIRVNLALEPGDYQFVYIARYGVYEDSHNEFNEDLKFSFGNQNVRVNDPDQDNFMFKIWESDETLVNQSFSLNQGINHFNIEGLGNRVDFGRILITGETTPASNPAPTCSVSANPSSGKAPLATNFTVNTNARGEGDSIAHFAFNVGDPDQWFGYSYDNDPAYNVDPAGTHGPYTYNNKGTYRVELKVWDTLGQMGTCSTAVNVQKVNPIQEQNKAPLCTVTVNPDNGMAPLSTNFTVTTDARGTGDTIKHFAFNIGDPNEWFGGPDAPEPAYHTDPAGTHGPYTYNNKGTYTVQLKVWDSLGQTGTCSDTVTIRKANYALSVTKTVSPSNTHFYWNDGEEIGKTFSYTMSYKNSSNIPLEKVYAFDEFYRTQGNLSDALLENLKCSPSKNSDATGPCQIMDIIRPGQEPFKVIYWNLGTLQAGETGYLKLEGKVKDLAPNWVEGYLLQNDIYMRDAWEGQESTPNVEADDHVDQWLHINGLPVCSISATPNRGPKDLDVDFSMSASDDIEIKRWTLNTGVQSFSGTGMPPASKDYTYTSIGDYVPQLTVYDNNNVSANCETQVKVIAPPIEPLVKNNPPECDLVVTPESGIAPLDAEFMMRARDDKGLSSWTLTTGDGKTFSGSGEPPQFENYTYQTARKSPYTSTLTVVDTDNVSAICTDTIKVNAGPIVDTGVTTLDIEKYVRSSLTSKYSDADDSASALDLGKVTGSKTLYYKVELPNTGDREATTVVVKDTFTNGSYGTSLVEISSVDGATYDASSKTFTISKIPGYSSKSFTYKATIKAPAQGDKEIVDVAHNTARIQSFDSTAPNQSGVGEQDPAYIKLTVPALAQDDKSVLTIDKSVTPASPTPANIPGQNGSAQYTIKITNTITAGSGVDATQVKIRDSYSSTSISVPKTYRNVSGASWDGNYFTLSKVSKGNTATITYTVDFDTSNIPKNVQVYLTNTATMVSADGADLGLPREDQATVKLVGPGGTSDATFTIKKEVEDDKMTVSDAEDKEDLDYTITVTNTSEVEGEVRVTDTLKNGDIEGTEGGEFSYNNDLRVNGAISYSGDLDETNGVLLKIAAHKEVTLKYSVEMKNLDEIDNDDTSKFKNTARLSTGEEDSVTVEIETEESDFSIKKTIKDTRNLGHGDIVTYEITIENTGDSTDTVEVTDTISKRKQDGIYYLPGKNGGRLEYIPDSMEVDGISKKDVHGKITSHNGVELEDVEPDDEVTISYQMRVVIDGIRAGASSVVENEACVEFGDDEECDDAELTIVAGITPVPPLPPLPVPPPTPITPVTPAIVAPPTYFKTGASAATIPAAGLATSLGALISYYVRKKRLLGL